MNTVVGTAQNTHSQYQNNSLHARHVLAYTNTTFLRRGQGTEVGGEAGAMADGCRRKHYYIHISPLLQGAQAAVHRCSSTLHP